MSTQQPTNDGGAMRAALRRVKLDHERVERLAAQLDQARHDLAESEALADEIADER